MSVDKGQPPKEPSEKPAPQRWQDGLKSLDEYRAQADPEKGREQLRKLLER